MRLTHSVLLSALLTPALLLAPARAQEPAQPPAAAAAQPAAPVRDDPLTSPRTKWFRDAQYGMFIHWGIYSVAAGEYNGQRTKGAGEWIMHDMKIPVAEYEKLAAQFNPVKFNAEEWAQLARAAGMQYVVITSKHHDGFSMFDTKANDYNVVKATPFKTDPIKELAAACKAEGLKFGLYYSIMDWHDPDANAAGAPKYEARMREQLREIITQYDPDLLWFDGEWVDWWTEEKGRDLEKYVRGLKPALIINNRIGKRKTTDGDYETPEQEIPKAAMGTRLWETCMTLNDTWGYRRDDHNWKSPEDVLAKLCDISSKGGNFLLNVGPTAEGKIPTDSVRILEDVGRWLAHNGEAIFGTTYTPIPKPDWGYVTRRGRQLYLIVFDWREIGMAHHLNLISAAGEPEVRKNGSQVRVKKSPERPGINLFLPGRPDGEFLASIVTMELYAEPVSAKTAAAATAAGQPAPVAGDGSVTLPAASGSLHGQALKLEGAGEQQNIGFWTSAKDYVEWVVQPKAAGKFRVEVTYACEASHGGEYLVQVGDQKLTGKSESTGGWQTYKTVSVGTVMLPAEKSSLTIRPQKIETALMNVRSVRLVPEP